MISLIHPSSQRPEKSRGTMLRWLTWSKNPLGIEMLISVDTDQEYFYKKSYEVFFEWRYKWIVNDNNSAVDAINNAAKYSIGDILIVVSDDTDCFPGWDEELLRQVEGKSDWILKTKDGIQDWIITMPVMDRAYYNRFGYIYYPEYKHMFCDTELTCVADITGRKIKSNLLFPHKHYSVTNENRDELHKRNDNTWNQGEKLFLERYKRNFDLPPGKPIQDNGMINWLQRKVR